MCGIVGYVGQKRVVPVIIEGLRRLEYRGYDSAGVAVAGNGHASNGSSNGLQIRRAEGKLRNLEEVIRLKPFDGGTYGIGHTRWATHGRPSEENAHPHRDCTGKIVVVHNGIVENYLPLKKQLIKEGHKFSTETDTEVIAHLIERSLAPGNDKAPSLEEAVRRTVKQLNGVFALAVISSDDPDKIIAARNGPPVVIGLGDKEYFVASDIPAILYHTRDVFFLHDGDLAVVTKTGVQLTDFDGNPVVREVQHITWDPIMAEKGGFKHFMLKEIYEQPRAVRETAMGRISLDSGKVFLEEMEISEDEIRNAQKLQIAACGTSWHAGLAGKFMIERLARLPVEVDYASEYRYRDPITSNKELTLLITQSGETADTIAAQREAKSKGSKTLAICNVVGAMIAREAAGTIYTHAGPEIGVASTKAFTAQLTALFLLALRLGDLRGTLPPEKARYYIEELVKLPGKLEVALAGDDKVEELARQYMRASDFLFLGRGIHYPIALEGALKLKEISYIHAEGYPAGEMKHGPNALIDEDLPVVVLATRDPDDADSVLRYEKTMSNIKEVKAREG
ncbi:MAG: glutamine--fructose-6-phosphate transaminase (isomerizing), partial [Acidobacteriia bacterium]|nr:glutamine--fructose-6-phosphate transaminase (isomerizing) [Terriglobia bacterium]